MFRLEGWKLHEDLVFIERKEFRNQGYDQEFEV